MQEDNDKIIELSQIARENDAFLEQLQFELDLLSFETLKLSNELKSIEAMLKILKGV